MVNKRLISRIVTILFIIDIFFGVFFLALLLAYSSIFEGSFATNTFEMYLLLIFIVLTPIGMIFYFILDSKIAPTQDFFFGTKEDKLSLGEDGKEKPKGTRFSTLLTYDEEYQNKEVEKFDEVSSLEIFADNFRNFCATEDESHRLYYSKKDIRSFIANLATSHIMILQGMSGTGKTSIATAFQRFVKNNENMEVIAIQPMWKERSDLLGYYNEFTKKFNETQLLKELYLSTYSDKMFVVILDEMNIARVEYYFAEFLSLLELEIAKRNLIVTNETWPSDPIHLHEGKLHILDNVYFLGTANNDESTFSISDKVYDRAMIMNLDKRATPFDGIKTGPSKISNTNFIKLVKDAKDKYGDKYLSLIDEQVGKLNSLLVKYFEVNFGNRMVAQIKDYVPVYVACGGSYEEAFDDFVAKKILRKLEAKDPIRIKDKFNNFLVDFKGYFKEENIKECLAFLEKYN